MLTKEERAAIAERANRAKYSMDSIFEILHGYSSPEYMSLKDDFIAMVTRVLDLCDTSNMLELPVDVDGEPILIGNIVYDNDNVGYEVTGYTTRDDFPGVLLATSGNAVLIPGTLTHKQHVTIKSLAKQIKNVLDDDGSYMPNSAFFILSRIVDQLEHLGDNDD